MALGVVLLVSLLLLELSSGTPSPCLATTESTPFEGREFKDWGLEFCGFYQDESCCNVGHSTIIYDAIESLLSVGSECRDLRVYNLASWYCMACHPNISDFHSAALSGNGSSIKVCKSWVYANDTETDTSQVLANWLNESLVTFCGLRTGDSAEDLIVPRYRYNLESPIDAGLFLQQFFQDVPPPFMSGYSVEVVDDSIDNHPSCFKGSSVTLALSSMVALLLF